MNGKRQGGVALARALSKLGYCSRSQALRLIGDGRVRIQGVVQRDPEKRVRLGSVGIEVDGTRVRGPEKVYLLLNKPRGLITTSSDERGRATVFQCLASLDKEWRLAGCAKADDEAPPLPRVFPVGRLDKASEGLLLFTNDTAWAARITAPESRIEKTYHVQVDCLADAGLIHRMQTGVKVDWDFLAAKRVGVLRQGTRNCWLEVVLDEGKNRHIRRLLATHGVSVLRLVRVAIGPLQLGSLPKGHWRRLTQEEVSALV